MSEHDKSSPVGEDVDQVLVVKGPLSPEQEAAQLVHELMHATAYALHTGDSGPLKAMQERWHAFCVGHPEIGRKYGYDPVTQTWKVEIDPRLQKLIDEGKAPPYRPVGDRNKLN